MKETLQTVNRMQADGVIGRYAIGGAVGATFYLEPSATVDIDIFVALPTASGSALISLAPIYGYLTARGCETEGEYILIGGWPVQFLPVSSALENEAVDQAVPAEIEGVPTRVISAEHLVSIALHTARGKDYARILQFIEQDAVDRHKLRDILARHGLDSQWKQFERKYLGQPDE